MSGNRCLEILREIKDVAITGMNKEFQMIRLNGKAKRLEKQKEWMDRIFDENSSMNKVYPNESRYILEVYFLYVNKIQSI